MSAELKLGIIGTGQIAKIHLKRYADVPGVRMVAACDVDEGEARRVAERYDIPNVFTDYRELLAMDEVVAVDVCLHNNLHAPVSIAAMEAGKHVYCEKPLAGSYADGERMLAAARRTGRMLWMQLFSLFSPETQAARRLIDAGELGRLYYAKSSYYRRRGRPFVDGYGTASFVQKAVAAGGALFDMGVYHIAQVLYLLGNPEVLTVTGATHQELEMYPDRREASGYDVEELGVGLVRLAGGVTFFIEEAWAIHLGRTDGSKLVGTAGGVTLEPFTLHKTVSDMEMDAGFDLASAQRRWQRCLPDADAYQDAQHYWAAALRGDVELLPAAEIGLNTMLISEGVYLSHRLAREVTAAEIVENSHSSALDPDKGNQP